MFNAWPVLVLLIYNVPTHRWAQAFGIYRGLNASGKVIAYRGRKPRGCCFGSLGPLYMTRKPGPMTKLY